MVNSGCFKSIFIIEALTCHGTAGHSTGIAIRYRKYCSILGGAASDVVYAASFDCLIKA